MDPLQRHFWDSTSFGLPDWKMGFSGVQFCVCLLTVHPSPHHHHHHCCSSGLDELALPLGKELMLLCAVDLPLKRRLDIGRCKVTLSFT